MLEKYDWLEIFEIFQSMAKIISPNLLDPVEKEVIKFQYDGIYGVSGIDWVELSDYDNRIQYVTKQTNAFLYFGHSLNKGTLQTAKHLIDAKGAS